MERIKPQMIVEDSRGRRGVTAPDFMACCAEWETPVVWYGESGVDGTDTDTLKVIGPENAKADLAKCGAGKGADCCIYMTASGSGFSCERFSYVRYSLIFAKSRMTAQRDPVVAYPECQNEPRKEDAAKANASEASGPEDASHAEKP